MKLWTKIFLFTLVLFIIAFYSGIFFMTTLSYKNSLDTVRSQAFAEHNFITKSLSKDLDAVLDRNVNRQAAIVSLIASYTGYYKSHHVYLELFQNKKNISGNLPSLDISKIINSNSKNRKSVVVNKDSNKYVIVIGSVTDEYLLVYARDITSMDQSQNNLSRSLIFTGIGISLIFVFFLFLIVKNLTKPIRDLQKVTKEITEGNYEVRAKVAGEDEIAILGKHFNEMTDEVVSRIEEHRNISIQKQRFIDNLAHELKTPMTSIYGYAELLQNSKLSSEDSFNATSQIMYDVKRIQSMSQKLLDLALTREVFIEKSPINLPEMFEQLKNDFHTQLKSKNIGLNIQCQLRSINGDRVLIENLFANLIDNAIKASFTGGEILIISDRKEEKSIITVKDEGIGISKEHINQVFEPFFRSDFSRSSLKGGTGLGLALSKEIASAHHAKIEITSNLNEGTSIQVIFTTS